MPARGESYKHRQIKDEIYEVISVDSQNETARIESSQGSGGLQVTFDQLAKSYKKVR